MQNQEVQNSKAVWIQFSSPTGLIGKAKVEDSKLLDTKMISKVDSKFYTSCLNEINLTAEDLFPGPGQTPKLSLQQWEDKLFGMDCQDCRIIEKPYQTGRTILLSTGKITYYEHDAGQRIAGIQQRQWIYVTCPNCNYQWSFRKLGIANDEGDPKDEAPVVIGENPEGLSPTEALEGFVENVIQEGKFQEKKRIEKILDGKI